MWVDLGREWYREPRLAAIVYGRSAMDCWPFEKLVPWRASIRDGVVYGSYLRNWWIDVGIECTRYDLQNQKD